MRTSLTFRSVIFHTKLLPENLDDPIPIFEESNKKNVESVKTPPEAWIVRWLLSYGEPRNLLLSHLSPAEPPCVFAEVKEPVVQNPQKKPGDIDILFYPTGLPQQSTAVECKRVKVTAHGEDKDTVNKIENIGIGVKQANGLAEMGFYRCFLAVIVVVDGRERREYNVLSRSMSDPTFQRIYEFPLREDLHPDVGIVFVEIIQPTGRWIGEMAQVGVSVDLQAEHREQSLSLTSRIIDISPRNKA